MSENVGQSVKLNWTEPYNGGSSLTNVEIEISAKNGSFYADVLYCNT